MSGAPSDHQGVAEERIAAAMTVLRDADMAAERTRAAADQYAARRQREADLLVQKARRLLVAADVKAAVILGTARVQSQRPSDQVIDLDSVSRVEAADAAAALGAGDSEFDRLLESAISRAVTVAFPDDAAS